MWGLRHAPARPRLKLHHTLARPHLTVWSLAYPFRHSLPSTTVAPSTSVAPATTAAASTAALFAIIAISTTTVPSTATVRPLTQDCTPGGKEGGGGDYAHDHDHTNTAHNGSPSC